MATKLKTVFPCLLVVGTELSSGQLGVRSDKVPFKERRVLNPHPVGGNVDLMMIPLQNTQTGALKAAEREGEGAWASNTMGCLQVSARRDGEREMSELTENYECPGLQEPLNETLLFKD